MRSDSYKDEALFSRPKQHHFIAAGVAIVASFALHALAFRHIPELPVGRPPLLEEHERIRPVVLGDVRQRMTETLERPDRFRPENPEVEMLDSVTVEAFKSLVETLAPPEPPDIPVTLTGEDEAIVKPEAEQQRERWDARSDILHIRDTLVPDDVAALPRRYVAHVERSMNAPDIALPVESPQQVMLDRGDGLSRVWSASRSSSIAGETATPELPRSPDTATQPELHDATDAPDAVEEKPEEIHDVAPIEKLLRMTTHTYVDPADDDSVYFKIEIERAGADVLPVLPKDMLIIQDASRSITQRKLDVAKEGLKQWLDQLNPGDRFELIQFNDAPARCFGAWTDVSAVAKSRAALFIENLRAQGGTDVFASLQPLFDVENESDRPVIAMLISDGVPTTGVVDSSDIIEQFSRANNGRVSVFAVGAGQRINRYLLDFISYKNRGDAVMTDKDENLAASISDLGAQTRRPVLMHLRYRFPGTSQVETYPLALTHLYLDRPLTVYGRAASPDSDTMVQILGRSGEDVMDMLFPLDFASAKEGDGTIRTDWAWQKIYHLIGEHIQTRDPALLAEIKKMSAEYGLRVLYGAETVPRQF